MSLLGDGAVGPDRQLRHGLQLTRGLDPPRGEAVLRRLGAVDGPRMAVPVVRGLEAAARGRRPLPGGVDDPRDAEAGRGIAAAGAISPAGIEAARSADV